MYKRQKFPTLGAWYDVINEYEFQTRCPIILKNSHRNKHFTFACHLKNCPFKVLLSYAGNATSSETSSPSANNNTNPSGTPDHIHHHGDNMNNEDNNNNNGNNKVSNDSKLDFVTDDLEYHLANTHPDDTNDKVAVSYTHLDVYKRQFQNTTQYIGIPERFHSVHG